MVMKMRTQLVSALLLSAAIAAPAWAYDLRRVDAQDLNHFIGMEVHGAAQADLGVVSEVDSNLGLVGLAGKHGEFAVLHTSLLRRNGLQMYAPTLTVGHIAEISSDHWAFSDTVAVAKPMTPSIIIDEPPYVEEPKSDLPLQ
jgi:hypothetical protein